MEQCSYFDDIIEFLHQNHAEQILVPKFKKSREETKIGTN